MFPAPDINLTETPRDAMQGIQRYIPAAIKAEYINMLLKCGFSCVDAGSFVSPKAVPQMADTTQVLGLLDASDSEIMVIVGNPKGGIQAAEHTRVATIGFPYSVSPTFLKRNINSSAERATATIDALIEIAQQHRKKLLVYLAMAFGNPYGDEWNVGMVLTETERLLRKGLRELAISDITAEASPDRIFEVCVELRKSFPDVRFRVHLHTLPGESYSKIDAAFSAGIRHFESATGGAGGCPMTGYEMVNNLNTYDLLAYFKQNDIVTYINESIFVKAMAMADRIFNVSAGNNPVRE